MEGGERVRPPARVQSFVEHPKVAPLKAGTHLRAFQRRGGKKRASDRWSENVDSRADVGHLNSYNPLGKRSDCLCEALKTVDLMGEDLGDPKDAVGRPRSPTIHSDIRPTCKYNPDGRQVSYGLDVQPDRRGTFMTVQSREKRASPTSCAELLIGMGN